jgi:hypothetical protein
MLVSSHWYQSLDPAEQDVFTGVIHISGTID